MFRVDLQGEGVIWGVHSYAGQRKPEELHKNLQTLTEEQITLYVDFAMNFLKGGEGGERKIEIIGKERIKKGEKREGEREGVLT